MKQALFLLIALCNMNATRAQITLIGKIYGPLKGDVILNTGRTDWFQDANSVMAKVEADSTFSFTLPASKPTFVRLRYNGYTQRLLLSPGRPLAVRFNGADLVSTITFTGKGATENQLIQEELKPPFYLTSYEKEKENIYAAWPIDRLKKELLPEATRVEEVTQAFIHNAKIPQQLKKYLQAETSFRHALHLDRLLFNMKNTQHNPDWQAFEDELDKRIGEVSLAETSMSPAANQYLETYAGRLMSKMYRVYMKNKDEGKKQMTTALGMSFDSLQSLASLYGDEYIEYMYVWKRMPASLHEQLLINRTVYYVNEKAPAEVSAIAGLLRQYYPNGKGWQEISPLVAQLETLKTKGIANNKIHILENGKAIRSLEELLAPYKGKVVYLDIWGTWCSPCKEEMKYAPAIKQQLAGKDVVFLYLSNDKDIVDAKWKNYIYTNNISGEHLRMAQNDSLIWKALQPVEAPRYFPSFFIFDRQGNRVPGNAARPSEADALYRQLTAVL